MDAGYGVLLKGDGKGHFEYVPQLKSGLFVKGCTRDLIQLNVKDGNRVIFGVNNQVPLIYSY